MGFCRRAGLKIAVQRNDGVNGFHGFNGRYRSESCENDENAPRMRLRSPDKI
jgi:hypothetical protein